LQRISDPWSRSISVEILLNSKKHEILNVKTDQPERWDLKDYTHFKFVAEHLLMTDKKERSNEALRLLRKIHSNFEILYSESEIVTKKTKAQIEFEEATVAKAADEPKAQERLDAADADLKLQLVDWCDINVLETNGKKADGVTDKFKPTPEEGKFFPAFFMQALYTMDRELVPTDTEDWTEFEDRINTDLPKDFAKFVGPALKYEDALESLVIKELVVFANSGKMHPESMKSMCLGLFDAFEQAHDSRGIGREFERNFVLADLKTKVNNQGKTLYPKNLQGPMREMPSDIKKEQLVTDIRFHTLKSKLQSVKTVDVILKEFIDNKVTIEIDVEATVEKETVYQPVRGHGRTINAGAF